MSDIQGLRAQLRRQPLHRGAARHRERGRQRRRPAVLDHRGGCGRDCVRGRAARAALLYDAANGFTACVPGAAARRLPRRAQAPVATGGTLAPIRAGCRPRPVQPPVARAIRGAAGAAHARTAPLAQRSRYASRTAGGYRPHCGCRVRAALAVGTHGRPAAAAGAAHPPGAGPDEVAAVHTRSRLRTRSCIASSTEAMSRFCAPNQKRRAAADAINYFKGIEYANAAAKMAAKVQGTAAVLNPPRSIPVWWMRSKR